jgi:hypothetical protein
MRAASLALGLAAGLALGWLQRPLAPGAPDRPELGLIRGRAMPSEWPGP